MAERAVKTILLVEDEAIIALSERKSLEKYGYSVVVAGNGERAIELVGSRPDIDLILMDIDLGAGMDGTEAAERILAGRDVPVVFLSSHTEPDIVERTERITSYGYVVKSAGITVLDASIKMAFKLFDANRKTLESEIKQNAMISNIADVIVIIDRDGIVRYKSPNSERWFGWRPDDVVGESAWKNIHPDDWERTRVFLGNLMETPGASGTTECRYRRKDGDYRWIEITLVNLLDDPVIRGMLGNYHDVTDRRRAEQERRFEQQFTEKLLDSLPGIFYLYTYPELRLVRWNRNHEALLGYGPGEIDGKHIAEWHLPGTGDAVRAAVDAAMERGLNMLEAPLLSKDGTAVPFLMTGTPFEAEGRRYLMGIGVDVTERRRAEEALRESEESLAITLQSIGDAVIATDIRGNITRMNDTAERLTGWSLAEAMGRPLQEVFNIMNAETGEPAGNPVERVLASGKTVGLANHTVLISRSGDERQIADSAAPIRDGGGRVSGVVLVFSDVTDKYRMEEALRESEARLSTLFGAMTEMVVLHELLFDERGVPTDYRIIDCNGAFSEIIGIRKEDAVGRPATEVYGQKEAPYLAEFAEVAITGKPLVFSTYYGPLNRHFSISVVSPWKNRFATITTDITDQKRTEMDLNAKVAELRETWELFSLFMDHLPAVVFIKDHEGRTVFTNKAMNDALGSKAWLGRTAAEIFDPETMRRIVEDDRRALELGYQKVQERFPHLDGKLYDYETQKFSIPRAGKPPLLGGIAINVTERNLAEARLREKSAELDRYFASSLDLLCIADLEGRFIRLNPEWEHVLGYSVEELEGKRFLDFVHPDDVESTVNAIGALQERREVLSFENRYRRKDGEYRWIEWRSHPEGNLIYAAARDVTARKLAETELQKQLAEKEILLKEVHHRIKNNIASIEALLTMQVTSVADPEAASALNEAIGRVNSMRILYEKLLMGETYEESSVKDYLESIVESVVALYPDAVRIAVRTRVDEFDLAPKKLFPLGIIVNELLTNVMKYAFVGRSRGSVDLLLKRTGASAVMVMQDDGIGLPADFRKTGTQRFGLMLVSMLGEQLGGRFSIESAGGTRCTLRFEL